MKIPDIDPRDMEKYSSAITLSDMEVFVFPELMYSLVLANIMSPIIWRWTEAESFKKLGSKSMYRKLMRLRQYIMDEYEFNLDLETWGLTKQDDELKRFADFIAPEDVAKSNALFGYSGDKYYFDVNIRRHFGLDKYGQDIIPYWKTETVEAMDAFRYKENYDKSAGECVSLSTLYAAAAFIVSQVPLKDIHLLLTPLHSQNFIDVGTGLITNNRRIVTKAMWFNGTAISMKAQRALKNEQVTIAANNTGYIHCFYDDATIDAGSYNKMRQKLSEYLSADFDLITFCNFLRAHSQYQKYFQFCREHRGQRKFVKAEALFHYEHGSNFRIADETYDKLLAEVADEDFSRSKYNERMCCELLCSFVEYENIDIRKDDGVMAFKNYLQPLIPEVDVFISEFLGFMKTVPKLPSIDKNYHSQTPIELDTEMSRQQVIEYMQSIRDSNVTADLAFYAYRDMERCHWQPFIYAAIKRNPVSIEMARDMSYKEIAIWLGAMVNESIYDGKRLAQPDEVANFKRADGLEKAFTMANIIMSRGENSDIAIDVDHHDIVLRTGNDDFRFVSSKGFQKQVNISAGGEIKVSS